MQVIATDPIKFTDWCHSLKSCPSLSISSILFDFFVLVAIYFHPFFFYFLCLDDTTATHFKLHFDNRTFKREHNIPQNLDYYIIKKLKPIHIISTDSVYLDLEKNTVLKDLRLTGRMRSKWHGVHVESRNTGVKIENAGAAIIEGLNRVYWRQKRARSDQWNWITAWKKKRTILVTRSPLRSRYRKLIGDHRCKTRSINPVYVHTDVPDISEVILHSKNRRCSYARTYFRIF